MKSPFIRTYLLYCLLTAINTLPLALNAQEENTFTVTINPSVHGHVTASPEGPYSSGTEVSLTATPNEGFLFTKWIIGEEEFTDNPLTFTIEADNEVTPEFISAPSEVAIYSNIPDPIPPDGLDWIFQMEQKVETSQPFITGDTGIISSINIPMVRWRDPSGPVLLEIWDDVEGLPGTKLHTVAEIEVADLAHGRTHSTPNPEEIVRINNLNISLEPKTSYHLLLNNLNVVITDGNGNTRKTVASLVQAPKTGTNGAGRLIYTFSVRPNLSGWDELANIPGFDGVNYLAMEIFELASAPGDEFDLTISPSANGSVTVDPEVPSYPAGTEVTLTATPNEGYLFTKWIIGEEEFTDNPLTFTIEADATLTPEFVESATEVVMYDTSDCHTETPQGSRPGIHLEADGPDQQILQLQAFRTGQSTSVDSITVDVGILRGTPTGKIGIEIWDENEDGLPGSKIAEFGEIDVASLPSASLVPHKLTTVEGLVSGLTQNSQYYVLFEHRRLRFGSQSAIIYTTCRSASGTNGAGKFLGRHPVFTPEGSWDVMADIADSGRNYLVMKVAARTHTLTITPNEHTVTISPDGPYSTGTKVTLTATPNDGHEFTKWLIGESEFTDNPLTFTIEVDTEVTPEFAEASSEIALYDNFPDPLPNFMQGVVNGIGEAGPPGPTELQPLHAQPFLTNEWGTVDTVSVYIVGTRDVKGTIDVVLTNDNGGVPGETVAVLETIDLETLTVWDFSPTPGDLLTFEANLSGLEPNTRHYIGFDITKMAPIGNRFPRATFFNLFRTGADGTEGAGLNLVGPFGEWTPLSDFVQDANHMLMRVTASPPPVVPLTIEPVAGGTVTTVPAEGPFFAGMTVSVSAEPKEGYEFVKWLYGDEEITGNPATITVAAGATLTPFFAPAQPKPIAIDILPAMAIRWDSEVGQTYEVQSSPDLENWTTEAGAVEGTGEPVTHFFVRNAREMYYRVLEIQ